ncbi:PREDICTED: polypeptide N-acetylgalactosaminyltransferase-like 6 isoform X1 [Priapulus caudatus]|uniref:Polypeptide N-acetylgalactosaminyltransferase n=1 Tax=Priapulus caudatus TaxID=37621 RepID=A0ABM1DXZ0_PRICU|nr:PREDICTED: polypeptide N-acetylgalactosaminyltransferase-like 6 isoform X1 [Priapulus caudatus]
MKRNSVTVVKYLLFAVVILVAGPLTFKFMFHDGDNSLGGGGKLPREGAAKRHLDDDFEQHEDGRHDDRSKMAAEMDRAPLRTYQRPYEDGKIEMKKIDWHDYYQIEQDRKRTGPGEHGTAVILSPAEEGMKQELYKVNGFNALVSDKISLNRTLSDIRHPGCKTKKYSDKLPQVSIVIPFHNEHFSTLVRTVWSVIKNSPPQLIKEVILVDDDSSKGFLKAKLDEYVKKNLPKTKVVRAGKREGLIRARLVGARVATGDVLIFLDSHCEANVNWLPPLLEPIAINRKTVACPFIDVIDYENFAYRAQDEGARGAFDWELYYKRLPLLPDDLKNMPDPFKSPVMAGGLFAMDREYFWELGGYDPGLDVWGGEQYELSFKVWQCDGQIVDIPCSRVGHIYRQFSPIPNPPELGDFLGRNYKRVAETWMDEYKEFIYMRRPHYKNLDSGDLTEQKKLRDKLGCKPFKWFMEEIAFDQPKKYPPREPPDFATGEIRNPVSNLCIDTQFRGSNERFGLAPCIKEHQGQGGEQHFILTWHKDLRPFKRSVCFDVSAKQPGTPVILFHCHGMQGNQQWKYNYRTMQLYHMVTKNCLDSNPEMQELYMNPCDTQLATQKWKFDHVNVTALQAY